MMKALAGPTAVLQRKCACGKESKDGGSCAECGGKEKGLLQRHSNNSDATNGIATPIMHETLRSTGSPLDPNVKTSVESRFAHDFSVVRSYAKVFPGQTAKSGIALADPVGPEPLCGARSQGASFLPMGLLQRQEANKEKTNEEKYGDGLQKLLDAFLKTPLGKELQEKIKNDTLVKGATKQGEDFISGLPGKIITGAVAVGAVGALAATHRELPAQIPEIPLDVILPGLSIQITYNGPVDKPTDGMISFKLSEQSPKGGREKNPVISETDKFRGETARLAAGDAKFRAGMKYKPGSPEDLEQKSESTAALNSVGRNERGPDLDAIAKRYPLLNAQRPAAGLQLTIPEPSVGYKSSSPRSNELKLQLPEKKKEKKELELQRKLTIGASNDPLEQEADQVADQVLAATTKPGLGIAVRQIQRYTGQPTGQDGLAPPSVDVVLARSGEQLAPVLRRDMERRFGYDFSHVRIHSDAAAEKSAREVNANAFTVGHNIVFGPGRFNPATIEGRHLIAHELAHVIQQGASAHHESLRVGSEFGPAEAQAKAAVQAVERGRTPVLSAAPATVAKYAGVPPPPPMVRPPQTQSGTLTSPGGGLSVRPNPLYAAPPKGSLEDFDNQRSKEAAIDEGEIPTASLARGGAAPDFITVVGRGQATGEWGVVSYRRRVFHILDAMEADISNVKSATELVGIYEAYFPDSLLRFGKRPNASASLSSVANTTIWRMWGQEGFIYNPKELDAGGAQRTPVFLAASQKKTRQNQSITTDELLLGLIQELKIHEAESEAKDQAKPRKAGPCSAVEVNRKGESKDHDDYADQVTGQAMDYKITTPEDEVCQTDGRDGSNPALVWEVKTRHEWATSWGITNAIFAPLIQNERIYKIDRQKDRCLAVTQRCGFRYQYAWETKDAADFMRQLWSNSPPIYHKPRM